jgi:hypothetical protein
LAQDLFLGGACASLAAKLSGGGNGIGLVGCRAGFATGSATGSHHLCFLSFAASVASMGDADLLVDVNK